MRAGGGSLPELTVVVRLGQCEDSGWLLVLDITGFEIAKSMGTTSQAALLFKYPLIRHVVVSQPRRTPRPILSSHHGHNYHHEREQMPSTDIVVPFH